MHTAGGPRLHPHCFSVLEVSHGVAVQQPQFTGCQESSQPSSDPGLSLPSANPAEWPLWGLPRGGWINLLGSSHIGHTFRWIFILFLQSQLNISLKILQKWLSGGYHAPKFSPLWQLEILSQGHVTRNHCPEATMLYFCFTQDSLSSFFFISAFHWVIRVALRLSLFKISSSTSQ